MAKCIVCKKTGQSGFNVSHSKRHTRHRWVANIQSATIMSQGKQQQVKICTRCLRTQYKKARV
ncbi:MAG: 50S ribosomal protein L28 [SAR202 cluster bacterium]|nr:50S ribosomal protein L28 [SAR202 cluster bacterium]